MPKNFIANFKIEEQQSQIAEFEISQNTINSSFNLAPAEEITATFEIDKANSDKYFVFEQAFSDNTWIIRHNLNKKASVTVVDEYDRVVVPSIEYTSNNEIILRFNFAFKGKAYLN